MQAVVTSGPCGAAGLMARMVVDGAVCRDVNSGHVSVHCRQIRANPRAVLVAAPENSLHPDASRTVRTLPGDVLVDRDATCAARPNKPMETEPAAGWISSSEFSSATYPPHGEFRLRMEGSLALYEATGPFNLQAIQGLALAREALLATLCPNDRIAVVVHFHQSAVMTPDAFSAWETGLRQLAIGRVVIAGVCWVAQEDVEGFHFLLSRYRTIFDAAQLPFHACSDRSAGMHWAWEQLALLQGAA